MLKRCEANSVYLILPLYGERHWLLLENGTNGVNLTHFKPFDFVQICPLSTFNGLKILTNQKRKYNSHM